jgi:hypothetical protein
MHKKKADNAPKFVIESPKLAPRAPNSLHTVGPIGEPPVNRLASALDSTTSNTSVTRDGSIVDADNIRTVF